jgi:hypothetical protein
MGTIPIFPAKEELFSLVDIEFRVKHLQMGKLRRLKDTKLKFLKSESQSLSFTYTSSSL